MSNQERIVNNPEDIYNFLTEEGKRNNENSFDFTAVTFKCEMDFVKQLKPQEFKEVRFKNAVFEQDVIFENFVFSSLLTFEQTLFKGNADFRNAKFKIFADFHKSKFDSTADFQNAKFEDNGYFFETNFASTTNFSNAKFGANAGFISTVFEDDTCFLSANFDSDALFWESIFENDANFSFVKFKNKVFFSNSKFCSVASFHKTEFQGIADFELSSFSGFVDFKNAIFNEKVDFGSAVFNNYTTFNSAQFYRLAVFSNVKFLNSISFNSSVFMKNAIFLNSSFKGQLNKFAGTIFSMHSVFQGAEIHNPSREIHRIRKHECLKNNNRIDALTFHQKEMHAYWNELFGNDTWSEIKTKNYVIKIVKWLYRKSIKNFDEKFVLFFNRYSNYFGLSWRQGVLFTLFYVGIPFFLLYLITLSQPYFTLEWNGWREFKTVLDTSLKYYVQFLNPAHSFYFMEKFKPNPTGLAYVIDGLSRIFITFGYYQTIQAFRKYRF